MSWRQNMGAELKNEPFETYAQKPQKEQKAEKRTQKDAFATIALIAPKVQKVKTPEIIIKKMSNCLHSKPCRFISLVNDRQVCSKNNQPIFDMTVCPGGLNGNALKINRNRKRNNDLPSPRFKAKENSEMSEENFFNFPIDKYPKTYLGPSQPMQGFLTNLIPHAQQTFQQFPGQRKEYYNHARGDIGRGYDTAIADVGKTYQSTVQPALQQTMNDLGRRGMLNSKLAGDTIAGTARGVGQNILGQQSQLQLGRQRQFADLTQQEGLGMYQHPQLLTNLLAQGRFAEESKPDRPYKTFANLLTSLMGYGSIQ
ncbi:MAG: hypothetical protein JRD93_19480 [Deltaproteobacteria bacterium]|nr:hypothetical protein [Deltaproteobacteria bacterium]